MDKKSNEIYSDTASSRSPERESPSASQAMRHIQGRFKNYSDEDLQSYLLDHVSRTFALTIPELPSPLAHVVSNAYLLCRIVDTVEDEPALSAKQKKHFCNRFVNVV
jgi:farnesyl-diphosphate farnesyltransferase